MAGIFYENLNFKLLYFRKLYLIYNNEFKQCTQYKYFCLKSIAKFIWKKVRIGTLDILDYLIIKDRNKFIIKYAYFILNNFLYLS